MFHRAWIAHRSSDGPLRRALALGALVALAAVVRLYRFDLTWFALDQVRDVSVATEIATGTGFPLLGPRIGWTDAYLGPLYFYLLAVPFAIARDPLVGVLFVAAGQLTALLLLYRFAREFFGPAVALYSVALAGVFPLTVFSSRLVWHAGLLPPFVIVYMHALFRLIVKDRSRAVVPLLATLAVLTQLHLASFALGIAAVVAVIAFRPRIRIAHAALGAAVFVLLYAPYLIHELGHRLENLRALAAVAGGDPRGNILLSLGATLGNVATLFGRALGAFVAESEWPPALITGVRAATAAEALLSAAGAAVCIARLLDRRPNGADRGDEAWRRGAALLLLWVTVPALMLGTRQTPIWWYYLDPIVPGPFILAGIAVTAISNVAERGGAVRQVIAHVLRWLPAGIVACQAVFLLVYQHHTAERGTLIVDVPRLVVNGIGSPLDTLTSLPLGYRRDIVGALVRDFGVDDDGLARRVHGAVLGLPEENRSMIETRSTPRDPHRIRAPEGSHFLVARASQADPGVSPTRSTRIGPYAIHEYRPTIDYDGWRCGLSDRREAPIEQWHSVTLVGRDGVPPVGAGETLVCRGPVRSTDRRIPTRLSVHVVAWAPVTATRLEIGRRVLFPIAQLSRQEPLMLRAGSGWSMGLGGASETVFDVTGALTPGAHESATIWLSGAGRVISLDVYDGRSW